MADIAKNARNVIEEVAQLGWRRSIYRIGHELAVRTGVIRIGDGIVRRASARIPAPRHGHVPRVLGANMSEIAAFLKTRPPAEIERILGMADDIRQGKLPMFSGWFTQLGCPPDWHLNPQSGARWPATIHWSAALGLQGKNGDIKLIWEASRFPQAFVLLRAYAVSDNPAYSQTLLDQISDWIARNPYGLGPNWASGQEVAIRLLVWLLVWECLAQDQELSPVFLATFQRSIWEHAEYISRHYRFALNAVPNNHLIGEATALYVAGLSLPWLPRASMWAKAGKRLLQDPRCVNQFLADGGYCQSSFNYERLALHYLLWADRVATTHGDTLPAQYEGVFERSARFLLTAMDIASGRLSNWGANDGALLNPWTTCDFRDYRPLVNSLSYRVSGKRLFQPGPWDEELLWFFGKEALLAPIDPVTVNSTSFLQSGVHILRSQPGDAFVLFKCRSRATPLGHADELHTDYWWRGINVAVDGGSGFYNADRKCHSYFVNTFSHNTVTVDGQSQMLLWRRFTWLHKPRACLLHFGDQEAEGKHYAYVDLSGNVVHDRQVSLDTKGGLCVIDTLECEQGFEHEYDLHWLLADFPIVVRREDPTEVELCLQAGGMPLRFCIYSSVPGTMKVVRANNVEEEFDGWVAPTYGLLNPAISVHWVARCSGKVTFRTEFVSQEV